jgi:hypothetical protein
MEDEACHNPDQWLEYKLEQLEEDDSEEIHLPLKYDGSHYTVHGLYKDQMKVIAEVMAKIKEWIECTDFASFQPLRLTLNGAGGSGKSVVINTIVTLLRKMFSCNDVVRVVAPTGTAAFNVGGETFHHLLHYRVSRGQYHPLTMPSYKKVKLIKKFKTLLALIVDERSLVTSKDFGTTSTMVSETIYEGCGLQQHSFGGLPVVVLVGDDYQLPSTEEGALVALHSKSIGKMTIAGRKALLECGLCVMNLTSNKRVSDAKLDDKDLLESLRTRTDLTEDQVHKLVSLHLDNYERIAGKDTVQQIKDKAIFLFYTNAKRVRHNLIQLRRASDHLNPVAICRPINTGVTTGKADRRHFDSDSPQASLLCIGANVALESKNYNPQWGLHNGAGGIVREIVFKEGCNPNNGDLPHYVVVEFPLYCGPVWDQNRPKV